MGLTFTLIYLVLSFLSPADMIPALTPYRILLIVAVLTLMISVGALFGSPLIRRIPHQFILVLLFYGCVICSWLPHFWLGGGLMAISRFTPYVLGYFAVVINVNSTTKLHVTRIALVAASLYMLSEGFREYPIARATGQETPYVMFHDPEGGEKPRLRALGVLGDPNMFAQFLLALLPMLYVSSRPDRSRPNLLIAIPITGAFLTGVFLTGSRGAMLGTALLMGLYLRKRYERFGTGIAVVLVLAMIVGVNLSGGSRSISVAGGTDRLAIWSDGLGLFRASPLWGTGYYSFADKVGMTAHNSFLLCAAELGMIGFFLWSGAILATFYGLNEVVRLNTRKDSPAVVNPLLKRWAEALKMSLTVYLFTGFFLSDTYELMFFSLLGMGGAVYLMDSGNREAEEMQPYRNWVPRTLGFCIGVLALIYVSVRLRLL